MWEGGITPREWKYGILCPMHKKRDMMCDSYRAVTLLCTV